LLNKYIKCNIWRLAVQHDIYIYVIRLLKVKTADKEEECVNDRNSFLNLRGLGEGSEYCPASC